MPADMKQRVAALTPRQREIARLISLGCTTDEAAAILRLSPSTVDNHKARLMQSLGTGKTALQTRLAIKHRLSSIDDKLTATEKRRSGPPEQDRQKA